MALQDILDAIVQATDDKIAQARSTHQKRVADLKAASKERIAERKQELALQKEERLAQMKAKAQAHGESLRRNAALQKKQELLDALYEAAVAKLAKLPEKDAEAFLKACLATIKAKGELRASKTHEKLIKKLAGDNFTIGDTIDAAGGFIFVSDKEERDCTVEHLVTNLLRPQTEVDMATSLFSAA